MRRLHLSRIPVEELLHFLDRLEFPAELRAFARDNRACFAHLLFDVGYDYTPAAEGGVRYLKGSYYGLV